MGHKVNQNSFNIIFQKNINMSILLEYLGYYLLFALQKQRSLEDTILWMYIYFKSTISAIF